VGQEGQASAPYLDNDGDTSDVVEGILAHRVVRAATKHAKPKHTYLVKWQGIPFGIAHGNLIPSSLPIDSAVPTALQAAA
jgi:hypothetical protein